MPKSAKPSFHSRGAGPANTRLAAIHKGMFPLVDRDGLTKPVIQIIGEEAIASGIEEICLVVQGGEESLYRDYFRALDAESLPHFRGKDWALLQSEKLQDFGRRLHFAIQQTPEGFGHAVYQARSFVGDEPFLLLLGDHVYLNHTPDRFARQLIKAFEELNGQAVTGVQITLERDLRLFGTIRGQPIDVRRGLHRAELIVEKPAVELARRQLVTPGLPAGSYLSHFGMHVFSSQIFDSLEYLVGNNLRDGGEIQLTAAQEHLRQRAGDYYALIVQGQRYDTGIPYGLMETQLALALHGVHRTEICEAITRILAEQVKE